MSKKKADRELEMPGQLGLLGPEFAVPPDEACRKNVGPAQAPKRKKAKKVVEVHQKFNLVHPNLIEYLGPDGVMVRKKKHNRS